MIVGEKQVLLLMGNSVYTEYDMPSFATFSRTPDDEIYGFTTIITVLLRRTIRT